MMILTFTWNMEQIEIPFSQKKSVIMMSIQEKLTEITESLDN